MKSYAAAYVTYSLLQVVQDIVPSVLHLHSENQDISAAQKQKSRCSWIEVYLAILSKQNWCDCPLVSFTCHTCCDVSPHAASCERVCCKGRMPQDANSHHVLFTLQYRAQRTIDTQAPIQDLEDS